MIEDKTKKEQLLDKRQEQEIIALKVRTENMKPKKESKLEKTGKFGKKMFNTLKKM